MRKITTLLFALCVAVSMAQAKSQASSPANKPNIQPDAQRPIATRLKNSPALVKAARDNDLEKAKKLLEQGADPNSVAKIKATKGSKLKSEYNPLDVAVFNKNDEMKQLLLDAGAKGTEGTLERTILARDFKLARTLLNQGVSLDECNHLLMPKIANEGNKEGVHVMLDACPKDAMKDIYVPNFNKDIVQLFVDHGTDIAKQEQMEKFFIAIKNNDYDGVMAAIEAGVNVNEEYLFSNTNTVREGEVPLEVNMQASYSRPNADKKDEDNLKILSALLAAGADIRDFGVNRESFIHRNLLVSDLKGPRKEFYRERMRRLINAGFPVPTRESTVQLYNLLMNPNAVPQQTRNTAKPQKSSGVLDTVMQGVGATAAGMIGARVEQVYSPKSTTRTVTTTVVEEGVEAVGNATATTCAEQCRQSAAENAHIHYRGASGTVPYCTCDVCDDRLQKC